MSPLSLASSMLFFALFSQATAFRSQSSLERSPFSFPNSPCDTTCGNITIPYPFHTNASCPPLSSAFNLSCSNSSFLFLTIDRDSYRVLEFFPDGLLVDFPAGGSASCRQYHNPNSFSFARNEYFAISDENVLGLYDCEDSYLCKPDCETDELPGCDGEENGALACCYPLYDRSAWRSGEGFSGFSKYGCRGLSSWLVARGTTSGKRGVKLEWAVPLNQSLGLCHPDGLFVNATSVEGGVRCSCQDGFVGDGYLHGVGCSKSCFKGGRELHGEECYKKRHSGKKLVILAGVLAPALILASFLSLFCLLKWPRRQGGFDTEQSCSPSTSFFHKPCRNRLFTYHELDEATRGFEHGQKLADGKNGAVYAGVVGDGSHVAVQKVHCESKRDFVEVLSQIEHFSGLFHRNLARVVGCCVDYGYTPLVVYEYHANGTLEEHLDQTQTQGSGLDWGTRLSIAAETASGLAFLQHETSPATYHHDIKSSYVLLDDQLSAKITGFGFLNSSHQRLHKSDVYDFGLLLLEIITGSKLCDTLNLSLQKIKNGKLEEILDPSLYYHEQPGFIREQVGIVADIATRCVLFGADGKIGMADVARELMHIAGDSLDCKKGNALEETFSNSSLLQMISMSPDSIYLPKV